MDPATEEPTYLPFDTSAGNRFAYYSPEDHGAPLWITSILGLVYMIGLLLIRVYIKRRVFGWDDVLLFASSAIAVSQSSVIYSALTHGLGKTPEHVPDMGRVGKSVYSSRVLFLVAVYFAKGSVLFLLRRLFVRNQKGINILYHSTLGFTAVSGLVSVVISAANCPSSGFFVEHCRSQVTRWSVITGLDVATEVMLLILPTYMVWQLQMHMATKIRVIVAFCFRLIIIVLSAMHLREWISYTKGPPSPILIINSLVWQQSLLAWSVVSATIPNLKTFLTSLSVNWGGLDWGYTTKAYGHGTMELNNMTSSQRQTTSKRRQSSQIPYSTNNDQIFETQVYTSTRQAAEGRPSGGSQDFIIRKETAWTVERT